MSRYMEGQTLHLQKQMEEQSEFSQDIAVELLKVRLLSSFSRDHSKNGIPSASFASFCLFFWLCTPHVLNFLFFVCLLFLFLLCCQYCCNVLRISIGSPHITTELSIPVGTRYLVMVSSGWIKCLLYSGVTKASSIPMLKKLTRQCPALSSYNPEFT